MPEREWSTIRNTSTSSPPPRTYPSARSKPRQRTYKPYNLVSLTLTPSTNTPLTVPQQTATTNPTPPNPDANIPFTAVPAINDPVSATPPATPPLPEVRDSPTPNPSSSNWAGLYSFFDSTNFSPRTSRSRSRSKSLHPTYRPSHF